MCVKRDLVQFNIIYEQVNRERADTAKCSEAHKWTAAYKTGRGAATSNELTASALNVPDHGSRFFAEV